MTGLEQGSVVASELVTLPTGTDLSATYKAAAKFTADLQVSMFPKDFVDKFNVTGVSANVVTEAPNDGAGAGAGGAAAGSSSSSALAIGLGIGLGVPALIAIVVAFVLIARRRAAVAAGGNHGQVSGGTV